RERAWQAYLSQPRKKQASSMQQTGGKFPPLTDGASAPGAAPAIEALQAPATPAEADAAPKNGKATAKHRAIQETARHRPAKETERKAKEQAAIARRARLYEEIRKAEAEKAAKADEERKKKEAGKKKKRKEEPDEVRNDGRLPMWKKGAMMAAALFLLYWM